MGDGAVVRSAWTPGRRDPSHGSEMVTQWLCGEVLEVRGRREAWVRAVGDDGYEAWAAEGSLRLLDDRAAAAWRERATARSLGARLAPSEESGGSGTARAPRHVPIGARLRVWEDGRVELPTGEAAELAEPSSVVTAERRRALFPPDATAVVRTAERWLGAPYLWGGRTEWGVDCSGLVQAAYGLHGVPLPRDSRDQREAAGETLALPRLTPESAGETAPPTTSFALEEAVLDALRDGVRRGDLLFFGPEGRGVTHVALAAGGTEILHAAAGNGCVAFDDLASDAPLARRLRVSMLGGLRLL